jgi:hypothetical protein
MHKPNAPSFLRLGIALPVLLLALLAGPRAEARYRMVLADGSVLLADSAPEVRGETVFFAVDGLTYRIAAGRVDLPASEAANAPGSVLLKDPPESTRRIPADAVPVRRFTDEDLPGEAPPPPAIATPAAPPAPEGQAGPEDLSRWSEISRREKELRTRRGGLEDRIRALEARKAALDAEDAKRRSDYSLYPTNPAVVAAVQDWTAEYLRRLGEIEGDLARLIAGVAEIDRTLKVLETQRRDLAAGAP